MATYISVDFAKLSTVSAQATALGRKMDATKDELIALQLQLREAQNYLEKRYDTCWDMVVPIKRLRRQSEKMDSVVSVLSTTDTLAKGVEKKLKAPINTLKLLVATSSFVFSTAMSVIAGNLTGETDCGNGWCGIGTGKTDLSNQNLKTSFTYGDGDLWAVEAYVGSKRFDADIWPKGYNRGDGCSVASVATAMSALGIQALPKDIIAHNGNSVSAAWGDLAKAYGVTYSGESKIASKNLSLAEQEAKIDAALKNYIDDPDTYTPPIIGFSEGYNGNYHYVVVYGKNEDGSYRCVDSSGNNMTTYRLVDQDYKMDKTNKVFYANLYQICQFHK